MAPTPPWPIASQQGEGPVEPELHNDLSAINQLLEKKSCRSLFLVADPIAYEASGARHILEASLASRQVTTFSDFRPNPSLAALENGIEKYRLGSVDAILAVGGGTAIDLAKLISFCAAQTMAPIDVVKSAPAEPRQGPPLIAVPTTSGTGSEATHFAVVYVEGQKFSVAHPFLLPSDAIVDATLTTTMPPALTAETGLDALCQAIESRWSIHSTQLSIDDATEAIDLSWRYLPNAVHCPTVVDRRAMCRASHLAGRAINLTKTTAPHAISYTITSQFGVPHGRAVALTLGAILAFNSDVTDSDCNDPRGVDFVKSTIDEIVRLLGCETVGAADADFRKMVASIGCPTRLREVGVTTDAQIGDIVERVNVQRLANNPRNLTSDSLRAILHSIR